MKGLIAVILGIIVVLLLICGVAGYAVMKEAADDSGSADSLIHKIFNKLSNVESSGSSDGSSGESSGGSNIVSEVIKSNEQNGEGQYREVTYDDGGFRQYDTESGKLIGSSYDSDQDKLPSLE